LGAFFGVLPGTGPAIASFSCYVLEKRIARYPSMEENLRRALVISRGDPSVFVTRPITLGFVLAAALILNAMAPPAVRRRRAEIAG
jgi:TctA family transporter